jgi:hypothetical protein
VTAQFINAAEDFHLWSEDVARGFFRRAAVTEGHVRKTAEKCSTGRTPGEQKIDIKARPRQQTNYFIRLPAT